MSRKREPWIGLVVIVVATALLVVSASLGASVYGGPLIPVFALSIVHSGSLVLTLVRPRAAAVVAVLASLATALIAVGPLGAPWPWAVTTLITQVLVIGLVTLRMGWKAGAGTLAASFAVSALAAVIAPVPHGDQQVAVNLVIFVSIAGGALALGLATRQWQVIRSQLARERQVSEEERSRRVIAEEKTRIARELHDVIAHGMSIVTMQSSSAGARYPGLSPELRAEFDDIAAASRRALTEMRSLLSVLRDENAPQELAPQPTLSRIPELVEQSAVSGTRVRLEWSGDRGDDGVADSVGLAAYRIVQEALSNVIRHAPGASAEVRCDRGDERIVLEVENTPTAAPTAPSQGGHGLLGMRERAASVGGTLSAGPTPSGGFLVRANLPLAPEAAAA